MSEAEFSGFFDGIFLDRIFRIMPIKPYQTGEAHQTTSNNIKRAKPIKQHQTTSNDIKRAKPIKQHQTTFSPSTPNPHPNY
ncbi:MAG: hypothetical protein R2795_00320 [Saprospiraceae bacterium]